jgi:hypothetical protein
MENPQAQMDPEYSENATGINNFFLSTWKYWSSTQLHKKEGYLSLLARWFFVKTRAGLHRWFAFINRFDFHSYEI